MWRRAVDRSLGWVQEIDKDDDADDGQDEAPVHEVSLLTKILIPSMVALLALYTYRYA